MFMNQLSLPPLVYISRGRAAPSLVRPPAGSKTHVLLSVPDGPADASVGATGNSGAGATAGVSAAGASLSVAVCPQADNKPASMTHAITFFMSVILAATLA